MAKKERIGVFIVSVIAGVALSIASLRTTGNAVGTLGTTTGLLGVFLFIFGLLGIVFNSRNK